MESTNILLNGWLIYQTISSRMYGKTGFYQSGGAYGFRDQLQDCMLIKYVEPNIAREQILRNCRHQFIEGDVEHWWHEETDKGIRTRISDDLLWLPYVVADYISFTGDYEILEENPSYKDGLRLSENENERYDLYKDADFKESVYKHCIRAIEKAIGIEDNEVEKIKVGKYEQDAEQNKGETDNLGKEGLNQTGIGNFGEHGLPKIGTGDWNDGMSNVGAKGKGESVWLGFFMYAVLKEFIPICERISRRKKNISL